MAEVNATKNKEKEEEEEGATTYNPVLCTEEVGDTGDQGKDDKVLEKGQVNSECSPELQEKCDGNLKTGKEVQGAVRLDATCESKWKGLQNVVTSEDHGIVEGKVKGTCSNKQSEVLKEKQSVVDSGGKRPITGKKEGVKKVERKGEKKSAIVKKKMLIRRGKIDIPLRGALQGKRFVKLNRSSAFGSMSRNIHSEESACLKEMKKKFMAETGGTIEKQGVGKKKGIRPDRFSKVRFVIREKNGTITQTLVKKLPKAGASVKSRILLKKKMVGNPAVLDDNNPVSVNPENKCINKKIITVDMKKSNKGDEKKDSIIASSSLSSETVQSVHNRDSDVDQRCTEKLTDEVSISYNINNTGWVNIKKEVTENMNSEGKKETDQSQYSMNDMMKSLSNVMYKKTGPSKVTRPNLKMSSGLTRITIGEAFGSIKPHGQGQQSQEQIAKDNSMNRENSDADEVQILSEGSSQQYSFSKSILSKPCEGSEIGKGQLTAHRNSFGGSPNLPSSGEQRDPKEKRDLTLKMKELLCFTFQHEQFPTSSQIALLAKLMGMPWSHIKKWFYRRRLENKKAGVYPRAQKMTFCSYCKVSLKTPEEQKTHLFLKSHIRSILGSSFDTSLQKRKEQFESKCEGFSVEAQRGLSGRPAAPLVSEGLSLDSSQKGGETVLASGFAINRDWQKEDDNRNMSIDDDEEIQEVARSITKQDLIEIDLCIEEMTERKRLEDEAKAREAKAKEAMAKIAVPREAVAKEIVAKEAMAKEVNANEAMAEKANAKETNTKEANVREMNTKEANAKETNAKEAHAKETKTKEANTKEAIAKEANAKEALNIVDVCMKEETPEEEKVTAVLGNSNPLAGSIPEDYVSETPNTKGLKQMCKTYTKWQDTTGGKVFGNAPPKLNEFAHPYVQMQQPVIPPSVTCIEDCSSIGYKCPVCQKIFQSEWYLMKHSLFHRVFMCSLCASYHPSEANLKEHILQHLSDAFEDGYHKEFSCKICRSLKCTCVMPNVYRPQALARMYARPQKAIRSKPFSSSPMAGPNDHLRVSFKEYKRLLRRKKTNLSSGGDVKKLLGPATIEPPGKCEEAPSPAPKQVVRTKIMPAGKVLSQPSTSNVKEEVSDDWKFKKPIKYVAKDILVSVPTLEISSQDLGDLPKISVRSDLMPTSPPFEKPPHIPAENIDTYFPSLAKARKKVKVASKRPAKELSNNYIYKDTDFYYLCEMCDASFLSKAELNEHMFFHRLKARSRRGEKRARGELQEEELEAEPATKSLKTGETVANVEKIVVSGFERFKCPMCKGHFASVQDLNRHRTQAHKEDISESQVPEDTKPKVTTFFKCKFCSKLYRREREFRRHLRRDCVTVPKSLKAKLTVGKTLFELPIPAEELPFTQVQVSNDTFEQNETSVTPEVVNLDDESSIVDIGSGESSHKIPKWVVCKYCDRQFVRDRERRRHIWQYCTKAPPDVVKMLKAGAMLSQVDEYEGKGESNTSIVGTSGVSVQKDTVVVGEMLMEGTSAQQENGKEVDDNIEKSDKNKEGSLSSSIESQNGMATDDLDKEGNENDSFSNTDDGNESLGNSPKTFISKRGRRGHSRCRFKRCYKVLPSPDLLLAHMSLHTGPKNGIYRCKLCRAAKQKWRDLKEHVWMHTGEAPYRCHICKTHYRLGNDIIEHFAKEHEIYITEKELTKWLPDSKGVYCTIKGEEEVLDLDSDLTFTAEIQVVTDQQLACMTDSL